MTIRDKSKRLADRLFYWRRRRAVKARIKRRLQWVALSADEQRQWIESVRKIGAVRITASIAGENIRRAVMGQIDAAQ